MFHVQMIQLETLFCNQSIFNFFFQTWIMFMVTVGKKLKKLYCSFIIDLEIPETTSSFKYIN